MDVRFRGHSAHNIGTSIDSKDHICDSGPPDEIPTSLDRAFIDPPASTFIATQQLPTTQLLERRPVSVIVRAQFAGNMFLLQTMPGEPRIGIADGARNKI